jgi:ribosomal protein L40E
MHKELETVETLLRQTQKYYDVQKLVCISCGRRLPTEAKQCHPCRNVSLVQKYCTMDSRIADHFEILRTCELWPSTEIFQSCSDSDIVFRFMCAKRDLKQECAMASLCPLRLAVESLSTRVHQIEKSVQGFCLRCVRREARNEDQKCNHEL